MPESSGWHKVSERYREACTDLMSEDPLHSLWTEGKSHTISFPLVCSQRQGQRSDSRSSRGQAPHCWETRAPMSGGDVFGFHLFMFSCRCFLKKIRVLQSRFKKQQNHQSDQRTGLPWSTHSTRTASVTCWGRRGLPCMFREGSSEQANSRPPLDLLLLYLRKTWVQRFHVSWGTQPTCCQQGREVGTASLLPSNGPWLLTPSQVDTSARHPVYTIAF